jgi:sarcosine/dimethylglycine N-methyltransferase
MSVEYSVAVETARHYYNSDDADNFYFRIWGGEDIHIGLYSSESEPIYEASRRTVEVMADKLGPVGPDTGVLDVGGGYGGAMRFLARTFGCRCTVLNLSDVENRRDRQMNREQGLDGLIDVVDGNFAEIPFDADSFDAVWSQDAILHSDDRPKVVAEVARVLRPGGSFVMTDPMQTDDAPAAALQPIYERIHLESLASPGFYTRAAKDAGLELVSFDEHADQLVRHYARVGQELEARQHELRARGVSDAYMQRMKRGLQHWVDGGRAGHLTWGVFVFRKPAR